MLFDLRGRGRRRTIQGIYLGLAVLMGGGLVLFGVGSGNGVGGLFDAFKSGGGNTKVIVSKQEKAAERAVALRPRDARAWGDLARVRFSTASQNYDQQNQRFTSAGHHELVAASVAWHRYLKLAAAHPDPDIARVMVQVYLPGALGRLTEASLAQEVVADAQPKISANWQQLAIIAGAAGQPRKSALAEQKALMLVPKSDRSQLKQTIKQTIGQLQQAVTRAAATSAG